ncbi:MAG: DUF1206 domain-containing protein [Nodosilinea sp.]
MRLGHGTKGMLYGLIGLFAIHDLRFDQPMVAGSDEILLSLGQHPMGSLMLITLAIGLLGYVLWRFVQASLNPGHSDQLSPRRLLQRSGYGLSGCTYLGIAYTAAKLPLDLAVDFNDTLEDVAEVLFEYTIGPWLLLVGGLAVVGIGLTYVYGAIGGGYINDFRRDMNSPVKRWVVGLGKVGISARGVSFVLIGGYLMKAAYFLEDDAAGGLGKVFDQLDDHPVGEVWLGAIAVGFIAYAIYMVVAACYRRFPYL